MPKLTRWFIKTSFVYLGLALITGLWMAAASNFNLTMPGGLFPVYIHLLVLGWLTQLVFGVIYWMFPKYSPDKPRGRESLGWWAYAFLNFGLLLRAIVEPLNSMQPNPVSGWMLVASAVIQFGAGLLFVINSWSRIRER